MMPGSKKLLLVAWLMMPPGMAWADFQVEHIGQADGATSLLLQPPVAFLSREPATVMFPGPHDASRLGFSMGYTDAGFTPDLSPADSRSLLPLTQESRFSATAVGELAISERIGVFGKFGLRYAANDSLLPAYLNNGRETMQQMDQRYGVGLNVRASEVLSLHFEWERYALGGTGAELTNSGWDPWRERDVFGAGLRLGF